MSSHRRMAESDTYADMAEGVLPVQPLQGYGVVRRGAHPVYGVTRLGARPVYGIATNLRDEQKDPSVKGFLDWLVGGFEDEDAAASPTVGGMDIKTGKPMSPSSANVVVDQLNIDRQKAGALDFFFGDGDDKDKGPDWKKIALVVGVLGGGFVVWKTVVAPRLAQRKAGG